MDALAAQDYDFVYVHIEAPDEMGHQGSIPDKIKAIEKYRSEDHRTDRWGTGRSLHGFQDVSPSGSSDADLCPHTYR